MKVGIALKPNTPVTVVYPYLDIIDLVLIMTVEPGFGGQSFIENCLPKITALRQQITQLGLNVELQVDGGVKVDNIGKIAAAGADVFVAGSAVFSTDDYAATIAALKENGNNGGN